MKARFDNVGTIKTFNVKLYEPVPVIPVIVTYLKSNFKTDVAFVNGWEDMEEYSVVEIVYSGDGRLTSMKIKKLLSTYRFEMNESSVRD